MKKDYRKNLLAFIGTCGVVGSIAITAHAQSSSPGIVLQEIKVNTDYILTGINNLPSFIEAYFAPVYEMAKSWIAKEEKEGGSISVNQAVFAALNNELDKDLKSQQATSTNITQQLLLNGSLNRDNPALPYNANSLSFNILNGQKLDPRKDKDTPPEELATNYIKHLAGANFTLNQVLPAPDAKPSDYQNYYDTVTSIESFNAKVLSGLMNVGAASEKRDYLIAQASSSDWFKTIATEELGLVLRHILMYDSQIYVEISRLGRTQQEMVAAQAMTNTLLIIQASQTVGETLRRKVTGSRG